MSCLSPFTPAVAADASEEARKLRALTTLLQRRIADVERTATKCGGAARRGALAARRGAAGGCADSPHTALLRRAGKEQDACRAAAAADFAELCDTVSAAAAAAEAPAEAPAAPQARRRASRRIRNLALR